MLRLKELRDKQKLTQQQAATYLGVSRPTYTRYENGEREPGIEMLKKLADFFKVSIDTLVYHGSVHTEHDGYTADSGTELLENAQVDYSDPLIKTIAELNEDDRANVARYVDFMKKRNSM